MPSLENRIVNSASTRISISWMIFSRKESYILWIFFLSNLDKPKEDIIFN